MHTTSQPRNELDAHDSEAQSVGYARGELEGHNLRSKTTCHSDTLVAASLPVLPDPLSSAMVAALPDYPH